MKKYYLYRQGLGEKNGVWFFDDKFDSYADAEAIMISNAKSASWKVWKIEEIYDFNPE